MNRIKVLHIAFWVIAIPLIVILLSFVNQEAKNKTYKRFNVQINYEGKDYLVTQNDIKTQVESKFDSIAGQYIKQVDEAKIEKEIERNPYVFNAEVFSTIDGICKAEVYQRTPMVQLIDENGKSMYMDVEGVLMPDKQGLPVRVMVVNGHFNLDTIDPTIDGLSIKNMSRQDMKDIYKIATVTYHDRLFRVIVEQIYVNANMEYEMITKLGQHSVLIGSVEKLDEKLKKLKFFYNNALSKGGWAEYENLNLKYKNQVIGIKR
ncbi:MAG: hypothetical protein K9H84_07575 [Bacteroidales bacterium]|nr:hypothetical protein [Bacteroidales bacterium]